MDPMFYSVHYGVVVVIEPNIIVRTTCLALVGFVRQFYPTYASGRLEKKFVADGVVLPGQCTRKTEWIQGVVILFRGKFE